MGFNMAENLATFEKRLKKIDKAHNGGIFSAKRHRMREYKPLRLPGFQLVFFAGLTYAGLTGAKIYQLEQMGPEGYTAHLSQLENGAQSARIAAKLLQPDWVTQYVLRQIQVPQKVL